MRGECGSGPWGCCAASPSEGRGGESSSWCQDRATLAAWCGGSHRACSPGVESDTVGRTCCRDVMFSRGEGEGNVRIRCRGGKEPRPVPASPWRLQTERVSSCAMVVGGCEWRCSDGGERKGNPALSAAHWV
jgi:hypothetical protein